MTTIRNVVENTDYFTAFSVTIITRNEAICVVVNRLLNCVCLSADKFAMTMRIQNKRKNNNNYISY